MSKMVGSDARRPFKLGRRFYTRADALRIARELLGKRLVIPSPTGERVSGRIVETEAYLGVGDKASHAYGGRRTRRPETMYRLGGAAPRSFLFRPHPPIYIVTSPPGGAPPPPPP